MLYIYNDNILKSLNNSKYFHNTHINDFHKKIIKIISVIQW